MRSKIHTVLASAALMAAAVLATNSAMAETTTLNVPFSFTVAGKTCPAGRYSVKEDAIRSYVRLTNQDSSRVFTWILGPGTPDLTGNNVVLKFDVLGQTHALQSVQIGSMITSRLDKDTGDSEYVSARRLAGR